jgi:Icc-related predicted phosphoesterase
MKLHVLSDLHLDRFRMQPARVLGDALVIAGDVSDGKLELLIDFGSEYRAAGRPILFVPGNHEFHCGHSMAVSLRRMYRVFPRYGIELLHNRVLALNGVRFIGSTLWTDFAVGGADPLQAMLIARGNMADYLAVRHAGGGLRPESVLRWHHRAVRFLERAHSVPFTGPTVVITHHGVHPNSIYYRHKFHPLNTSFVSDLSERIIRWQPTLMIHGHLHHRFDHRVGATRIMGNPRGYSQEITDEKTGERFEWPQHDGFDPNLVIEI